MTTSWRLQTDQLGEGLPPHLERLKKLIDEAVDTLNRDGSSAKYLRNDEESGLAVLLAVHGGGATIHIGYVLPKDKDKGDELYDFTRRLGAKTFSELHYVWISTIPLVKS
ncbi:MAG TPA: hypothetical protein VLA88_01340 [Candidatus Saccharimonadales bacterium]|nr:hypothetical protein [Candidatus Saccharimonadales bacterium]